MMYWFDVYRLNNCILVGQKRVTIASSMANVFFLFFFFVFFFSQALASHAMNLVQTRIKTAGES